MNIKQKRNLRAGALFRWGWQKRKPIGMIVFTALFAAISWPFLSQIPTEEKIDTERIRSNGEETVAIILSVTENAHVRVNEMHPLLIAYQYESNNGTVEGVHQTLDFGKARRFATGDEVNIIHYEGKSYIPSIAIYAFPYWIFNIFYVIPLAIGLFPGIYLIYFFKKRIHLYTRGIESSAFVESLEPLYHIRRIGFRSLSKNHHRIFYSFTDRTGNQHFGSDVTTNKLLIESLKKGDEIEIVYLEHDPTTSCIFERFLTLGANKTQHSIARS